METSEQFSVVNVSVSDFFSDVRGLHLSARYVSVSHS